MARVTFDSDRCKGCGLCVVACLLDLLKIEDGELNKKGHPIAKMVDQSKCVGCASCAVMCPDCVITVER